MAGLTVTDHVLAQTSPAQKQFELTILHVNDHHSHLDDKPRTLLLKNASGSQQEVKVSAGGFPRVVSAFRKLAQEDSNVLKLHAGDALSGTLYFNRAGEMGQADATMMKLVCFDAFALGNHEFDKGDSALAKWLELLHDNGEFGCKPAVLSANVRFADDSALHSSRSKVPVRPFTIVERHGEKIGIIGLTIAEKTKVASSPDPGTQFEDELTAAQRTINELTALGLDKIILLSHIGYSKDLDLAKRLSGVDVIIGGDSHTLLGPDALKTTGIGTPAGPYPTVLQNNDGHLVCIVQAWEYAQIVGKLKVRFDPEGRVISCNGSPLVLVDDDFQVEGKPASPDDARAFQDSIYRSGILLQIKPDPEASQKLQPFKDKVENFKKTVVAIAPVELCSRRVPGGPDTPDYSRSSPSCNQRGLVNVRGGDIQQLVANAYLAVANSHYGGADISLQSAGGVRIPLEGTVTAAQVLELLPFGNQLWRLTLTAKEVHDMIEDGLQAVVGGGASGPYPYAGGLRWDVDLAKPKGSRASNIEFFDQKIHQWVPLQEGREYKLFVLSFNANGGDGYQTLANIPASRRMDIGVLDADAFMTYVESLPKDQYGLPVILPPAADTFSTKSFRYH